MIINGTKIQSKIVYANIKNPVNIKMCAHDAFLEWPSSGTFLEWPSSGTFLEWPSSGMLNIERLGRKTNTKNVI